MSKFMKQSKHFFLNNFALRKSQAHIYSMWFGMVTYNSFHHSHTVSPPTCISYLHLLLHFLPAFLLHFFKGRHWLFGHVVWTRRMHTQIVVMVVGGGLDAHPRIRMVQTNIINLCVLT